MTIQMTINSIKAKIENEIKKEFPDWKLIERLTVNGEIAQKQLAAYNLAGELKECKNFEV